MNRAFLLPLALLAAAPLPAQARSDVTVASFRAADAEGVLGHGGIVASSDPADSGLESRLPVYEHAVMDALGRIGYQVGAEETGRGQVAEITVSHHEVRPPEPPHKPVSGAMSTMFSNRGSGVGLALNIDLSKPKGALVATKLEVRIRDRASGKVLWEGRAETATTEKDGDLDHGKIADRLVTALFKGFPEAAQVVTQD
ncbi:DUF4136 domain-containing protein [Novosphingobium sp. ZN18A2]|uniref:DUF4136 domain-containing protein n=1 Tax=Novosphingobium sp. ZN18A2 TaxID=3079861 RepID=UPI0030CF336D